MLAEAILTLVSQGIPLETVYDLPLDVFYLYLEGASRIQARQRMSYISDTAAAVGQILGGSKEVKPHLDALKDIYEGNTDGRHQ